MNNLNRPHGRRAVLAGAAGLGIAAIAGGSFAVAQATPDASDGTTTGTTTNDTTTDTADRSAEAAARYDDFVTRLSGNLSIGDSTTVDAAIRAALTAMVDERLAAGEISANDATAAKAEIASSPSPVFGLFGGPHGGGRGGHGGEFSGRSDDNDGPNGSESSDDDTGTTDATPSATT